MLPEPNEPLEYNGLIIKPKKSKNKKSDQQTDNTVETTPVVSTVLSVDMLPDNPDNLKIINNILIYSLLGFRNNDIADLMSISPVQIDTIKQLKSYDRMVELVIDRVITNDSDSIRQAFHFTAKQAIEKLNTLLNSSNERVVLATAKDLLDRGGFRPAEMTESRNKLDNGLVIEYVSKDKAQAIEQATNGDK